jgi:hypothetical protein
MYSLGAGIVSGQLRFNSRQEQEIFLYFTERFWCHAASCPMGTGGLFPWGQSDRGLQLTAHLDLVPRSRMAELYLYSFCLHDIMLN